MPVTSFEILELPDITLVESKFNGGPLLINTLYSIEDQNLVSFERLPSSDGYYLNIPFKWRVKNVPSNIFSNEVTSYVKWITSDGGLLATSANVSKTVVGGFSERLLEGLPINEATEYIEIVSLSGVLNLKNNGSSPYVGQNLNIPDLYNSTYNVHTLGGGLPYFSMTYKAGNVKLLQPTIYTYELNVDSLAEIAENTPETLLDYSDEFDVGGVPTTYNVKNQSLVIKITKGSANGVANVDVVIASPYLALNSFNNVRINVNGFETEVIIDGTINLNVPLDTFGSALIIISNIIVEDTADPKTGQIDVNLISINAVPALVSATNTVQLLTNY